jgi:xylitol oxidase
MAPAAPSFLGASLAQDAQHPLPGHDASACTAQGEPAGPWSERLGHFRAEFEPSGHGDELQSEFFVPRSEAVGALRAMRGLHAEIAPLLHVSEVRSVASDDWWLSPAYGRDSIGRVQCGSNPRVLLHHARCRCHLG